MDAQNKNAELDDYDPFARRRTQPNSTWNGGDLLAEKTEREAREKEEEEAQAKLMSPRAAERLKLLRRNNWEALTKDEIDELVAEDLQKAKVRMIDENNQANKDSDYFGVTIQTPSDIAFEKLVSLHSFSLTVNLDASLPDTTMGKEARFRSIFHTLVTLPLAFL